MRGTRLGVAAALMMIGTSTVGLAKEAAMPGTPHEIQGKVLKVKHDTLYLDENGAAVPIKISKETMIGGKQGSASTLSKEIKAGDDVRASFVLKNETENHATSIEKQTSQNMAPQP